MLIANTFMLLTYIKYVAEKIDFVVCVVKKDKIQFRKILKLIVIIQKYHLKVDLRVFNLGIKTLPIS